MSEYVTSAYGEALFRLMRKKNIEKITVDELCEEGGIVRVNLVSSIASSCGVSANPHSAQSKMALKIMPLRTKLSCSALWNISDFIGEN